MHLESENKDELKMIQKEKNREKAQIFRQRKKEYIYSLEKKVEELEAKVYNLTTQLESYKSEPKQFSSSLSHDLDYFPEINSLGFDDINTYSKPDESSTDIEHICGSLEKLCFLFNQTQIDESKDSFKYFGKMSMCMKTELLNTQNVNVLERFMLESDMTPNEIRTIFHSSSLTTLNQAMKR